MSKTVRVEYIRIYPNTSELHVCCSRPPSCFHSPLPSRQKFLHVNQMKSYFVFLDLPSARILLPPCKQPLRDYDGNCKENVTLKLNFALNLLRLFHVGHVVQNLRIALSLAWHEWFSCKGKEEKIYCCELALSSENSRPCLAGYNKTLHQLKSVLHVQHHYFSPSTNQIIDLWRCR